MTDQCSSCFFGFIAPTDSGLPPNSRCCNFSAPTPTAATAPWLWPVVQDDYWCAQGADSITGVSFSAAINSLPSGPTGPAGPTGPQGPPGPASVLQGAWTAYTPSLTSDTGNFGTATAAGRYIFTSKTLIFQIYINITNTGGATGDAIVTLPFAINAISALIPVLCISNMAGFASETAYAVQSTANIKITRGAQVSPFYLQGTVELA